MSILDSIKRPTFTAVDNGTMLIGKVKEYQVHTQPHFVKVLLPDGSRAIIYQKETANTRMKRVADFAAFPRRLQTDVGTALEADLVFMGCHAVSAQDAIRTLPLEPMSKEALSKGIARCYSSRRIASPAAEPGKVITFFGEAKIDPERDQTEVEARKQSGEPYRPQTLRFAAAIAQPRRVTTMDELLQGLVEALPQEFSAAMVVLLAQDETQEESQVETFVRWRGMSAIDAVNRQRPFVDSILTIIDNPRAIVSVVPAKSVTVYPGVWSDYLKNPGGEKRIGFSTDGYRQAAIVYKRGENGGPMAYAQRVIIDEFSKAAPIPGYSMLQPALSAQMKTAGIVSTLNSNHGSPARVAGTSASEAARHQSQGPSPQSDPQKVTSSQARPAPVQAF